MSILFPIPGIFTILLFPEKTVYSIIIKCKYQYLTEENT